MLKVPFPKQNNNTNNNKQRKNAPRDYGLALAGLLSRTSKVVEPFSIAYKYPSPHPQRCHSNFPQGVVVSYSPCFVRLASVWFLSEVFLRFVGEKWRMNWFCWISGRAHLGWGRGSRWQRRGWSTNTKTKILGTRAPCFSNPIPFTRKYRFWSITGNPSANRSSYWSTSTRCGRNVPWCLKIRTSGLRPGFGPISSTRRSVFPSLSVELSFSFSVFFYFSKRAVLDTVDCFVGMFWLKGWINQQFENWDALKFFFIQRQSV